VAEPSPQLFAAGERLAANPDLYDYVHYLDLDPTGTVEMVDGGGQALATLVQGRWDVALLDAATARLTLTDLVELNPYYKQEQFRDLSLDDLIQATSQPVPYEERDIRSRPASISLQVTREEGVFALREQIIWNLRDERDWPYLLFRERYYFSTDPLASFSANRSGIPYFEHFKEEPDTRLYYPMKAAQSLTAGELSERGLPLPKEDTGQ